MKCNICNTTLSQKCSISMKGCCWCTDKRTLESINNRYIDGHGNIDVRRIGLSYPKDIFYCSGCKKSPHSTATFDSIVRIRYRDYINQKSTLSSSQILDDINMYTKYLEINKGSITKNEVINRLSEWNNKNYFDFYISDWCKEVIKIIQKEKNKFLDFIIIGELITNLREIDKDHLK